MTHSRPAPANCGLPQFFRRPVAATDRDVELLCDTGETTGMSDSVQMLAASGLGMLLAGGLLCAGLYMGYRAGRSAAPAARPGSGVRRNARLRAELKQCQVLAQQLARQAEHLTILASSASNSTDSPRRLVGSASDLLEQSAALCQRLERLVRGPMAKMPGKLRRESKAPLPPQPERPAPSAQRPGRSPDETRSRLSARELGQITESEQHQAASAEDLDRKHYAYDCVQTIIPWSPDDALLPALKCGIAVRCHDISGKGISFFWPRPPQFEHVIISLGSDHDLLFMAAQVMRFVPAERDGAAMYLVGCQFTRRMDNLTAQWKQQLGRREEPELAGTI